MRLTRKEFLRCPPGQKTSIPRAEVEAGNEMFRQAFRFWKTTDDEDFRAILKLLDITFSVIPSDVTEEEFMKWLTEGQVIENG